MNNVVELRARTKIHPDELAAKVGKVLTEDDYNVLLKGPTAVYRPDGSILCKYLPGYFSREVTDQHYPVLHSLRSNETDNRGDAAGTGRAPRGENRAVAVADGRRTRTQPVPSMIAGAFDASPPRRYCRLTAWSGRETEEFASIRPLLQGIGDAFAAEVPDRFQSQMAYVRRTEADWVVPGTPFTTITINNSYPTGVHTDKGDLQEGFSNLTVLRRGNYSGGVFVFAEYRIGVDMHDGDLLLMDAHEYHGNTVMTCDVCHQRIGPPMKLRDHDSCVDERGPWNGDSPYAPERISIVSYYRTKMADCGTAEEEAQKAAAMAEKRIGILDEMAEESAV